MNGAGCWPPDAEGEAAPGGARVESGGADPTLLSLLRPPFSESPYSV